MEKKLAFKSKKELVNAIRELITTNPKQAIKAMFKIFEYQTQEEKADASTKFDNGVGFTGRDAEILTSFCNFYKRVGFLSDKQMAILQKTIGKYAGQLVRHAITHGVWKKQDNVWVAA